MLVRITDTGKGFKTHEEQAAAKMVLTHIREDYYQLESMDPTAEQICAMFGYTEVPYDEVYPPNPPEPEVIEPTLDERKASKRSELDAACSAAIFGGVSYDGHVFPSAPMDIIYLMGAKDTLTRHPQIPWDTLDAGPGSYVMTAEKYAGLVIAFEDSRIGHQMKVNTLKAHAEAAKTPEELAAVVW